MKSRSGYREYRDVLLENARDGVDLAEFIKAALKGYVKWRQDYYSNENYDAERQRVLFEIQALSGLDFAGMDSSTISNLSDPGPKHQKRIWAIGFSLNFLSGGLEHAERFERSITANGQTYRELTGRRPRRRGEGHAPGTDFFFPRTVLVLGQEEAAKGSEKSVKKIIEISVDADVVHVSGSTSECQADKRIWFDDDVTHVVFVLQTEEYEHEQVAALWSEARRMGKTVIPVVADSMSGLPGWVVDCGPLDIRDPEKLDQLEKRLTDPKTPTPVHFAALAEEDVYVPRRGKLNQIRAALTDNDNREVTLTTALHGAGGFGKTVLARAICRDVRVRAAFHDGVFYIEVGRDASDANITAKIAQSIIRRLTGSDPGNLDPESVAGALADAIGNRRVLIVADDIWRHRQLDFLRFNNGTLDSHCANAKLLFTTRVNTFRLSEHSAIDVDKMELDEAVHLLAHGLPELADRFEHVLTGLAKSLHYCGLLLWAANRLLWRQINQIGVPMERAVSELQERAAEHIANLDLSNAEHRGQAMAWSIATSLHAIDPDFDPGAEKPIKDRRYFAKTIDLPSHAQRFIELGVFPEDEDVPLDAICGLWRETSGMSAIEATDLLIQMDEVALLRFFSKEEGQFVRLHDNHLHFANDELRKRGETINTHAAMADALDAVGSLGTNEGEKSSPLTPYYWANIVIHIFRAGQFEKADRLLTSFDWIKLKLTNTGPDALFQDYHLAARGDVAKIVGLAVKLSLAALRSDPKELAIQLWARLRDCDSDHIAAFRCKAQSSIEERLYPINVRLAPVGAEIQRFFGHTNAVTHVAPDHSGSQLLTTSIDGTVKLWDIETGEELKTYFHKHKVGFQFRDRRQFRYSGNGKTRIFAIPHSKRHVLISALEDGSVHIQDLERNRRAKVLQGHSMQITSVISVADGSKIITASEDNTVRVWNAETYREIGRFEGHNAPVLSVAGPPNGEQVCTISSDGSAYLWETESYTEVSRFEIQKPESSFPILINNSWAFLIASPGGAVELYDPYEEATIAEWYAHVWWVNSVATLSDGHQIVTCSNDRIARIWDTEQILGQKVNASRKSAELIQPGVKSNALFSISKDHLATLWDLKTGDIRRQFCGGEHRIRFVMPFCDDRQMYTVAMDGSLVLWDLTRGKKLRDFSILKSHVDMAMMLTDERCMATYYLFGTEVTIWDLNTGRAVHTLAGHNGRITSMTEVPGKSQLLTTSIDKSVKLWDLATGREIRSFDGHQRLGSGPIDFCLAT